MRIMIRFAGTIQSDIYMLSSIIRNLNSNSVKFTGKDDVVEIRSELQDGNVVITVADNGIGMSEETLGKLFKIESVYTTPGTNNEKGTGLGLALIAELIEKNGGTNNIKSTQGKGTEFTFSLKHAD